MLNEFILISGLGLALSSPPSGEVELHVEVLRHADDDARTATYTLGEPVGELRFPSNTALLRHERWEPTTASAQPK